ncbi:hypothetical protein F9L16_22725 [Agarivorans sp. B2Z047]|uniref:excisionase family protein n=1 Tax=Agarivorans sp. B2Z047 TaxID=2652721 RepID=UPI00128B1640|nr:excisionase family protein [Agarivorans sp. B2Z047]MPW31788.1 hypothetical protein [Agarivorans sp. B2Z047]UQN44849.1 excisionase family protein [Agarivorans sp. B2Z047]
MSAPSPTFVTDEKLCEYTGLTVGAIKNYRLKIWLQGKHWVKISTTGQAPNEKGRACVMYNYQSIMEWIQNYPQM